MTIITPKYRTDYIGENINGYDTDGNSYSLFVPPRENMFITPKTDTAIVLGNGVTRSYQQVQYLLHVNSKKVSEGYKLVYACNKAINDPMTYDYYVLRHRVFMSSVPDERLSQIYLPSDIFLDYKDQANLIPFLTGYDAGSTAAFIACFDGHKKVMLTGFDGDRGSGYETVYDGEFPYTNPEDADFNKWQVFMYDVMKSYKNVEFYRLQIDGQSAPPLWKSLPNFRDCNIREFTLAGDF
jgi:hypothetical protein